MPFTFPKDTNQRAGAIRVTADGNNYFVPMVLYAADGVTPISTIAPLSNKPIGKTVKDAFSGNATVTKTYGTAKTGILLTNDGASDVTMTVNGLTNTIKPTEVFDMLFDPFTSVTITTTSAYRAWISE